MFFSHWQSVVDFLVLAGAIYLLLRWAKQARAVRIALGIIGLHAGALVARNYDLPITSFVLSAGGFLAIAVLLVIFQPELRHAFMRLDTMIRSGWQKRITMSSTYRAIADAAFDLAQQRIGALIVLVRNDAIAELLQGGTAVGARVSAELIEAIFQKASPMHDGAVVIDADIMIRARTVLPLTLRSNVPPYFGTRHRAAMGLADRSDAAIVVVSEQRGTVTLMQDRKIHECETKVLLERMLEHLDSGMHLSWPARLRWAVFRNFRFKIAALGLAATVWGIALFASGAAVRTVTVPIVFTGVPSGTNITAQSTPELSIQLRGNSLVMDSVPLNRLAVTFNLSGAAPGWRTLRVHSHNLDLPFGVRFERSSPGEVSIQLSRRPM